MQIPSCWAVLKYCMFAFPLTGFGELSFNAASLKVHRVHEHIKTLAFSLIGLEAS